MKSIFLLMALVLVSVAKPLAPYAVSLNPDTIQSIPSHPEVDTLLVFPSDVESILGRGLTNDAQLPGTVLYQQGDKNPKTIVIRHLDAASKALMTVMIGDEAYVFRIEVNDSPASVINFKITKAKAIPKARVITAQEAQLDKRPIPEKRKNELLRLARESKTLQPKLPQEYEGYSEKEVFFTWSESGIQTRIHQVAKFKGEDALIFTGTISNFGNNPVELQGHVGLLTVGRKRRYSPAILRARKQQLFPNQATTFEGLLIGDGKGQPLHLSLENELLLQLTKSK